MDQKKIGRFLKELRKEKDITQEQLAEKIKVSGRSVSRWEQVLICLILVCWLIWLIFMVLVYLKSLMEKGKAII